MIKDIPGLKKGLKSTEKEKRERWSEWRKEERMR